MTNPHIPSSGPQNHKRRHTLVIAVLVILGIVIGALILTRTGGPKAGGGDGHGHGEHAGESHEEGSGDGHDHGSEGGAHGEEKIAKGPHGGRKLVEGDFAAEVLLAEEGGKTRLKAWLFEKDVQASLAGSTMTVIITRPGGERQEIRMTPDGDHLVSDQEIAEPRVFEATVELQTPKESYLFAFGSSEGRIAMSDAQVQAAGVTVETSGGALIRSSLQFPGEIRFNEDLTAHIVPRVAGVVEGVSANLGQPVKRGQVLASISSSTVSEVRAELQSATQRQSLARTTYEREKKLWEEKISPEQDMLQARQALAEAGIAVANASQKLQALGASASAASLGRFELRAPFDGVIVEKHIALGESVKEDANVFTVSDLSSVWAQMDVPARELQRVRVGDKVLVRSGAFDATAEGKVAYVGSLIGQQTRTAPARVTLANPQGAWRPGLFVTVELLAEEAQVPVAVASSAIQTLDDRTVVFMKVQGGFVPQPVQIGRSDGKRVEIVSGLQAGASYAAAGSFVVKSEQGKGSATHSH